MNWVHAKLIGAGFLLGTAGVKILSSKDAKKAYTHVTAAVLRGADCIVDTAETIKENCEDIYEDAKNINEMRKAEEDLAYIEDKAEKTEEKPARRRSAKKA